jgi:streptogramin lyase
VRTRLAVAVALAAFVLAGSAHAADLTVAGTKLLIRNKLPDDESKNQILFFSKDTSVAAAKLGSDGDPTCGGAGGGGGTASFTSLASGETHTTPLPCENWRAVGAAAEGEIPGGYQYRDGELDDGTCKTVTIAHQKQVKAVCSGKGPTSLDYDLEAGTPQDPVRVVITAGSASQRYCASLGGTVRKTGEDGKTFLAKNAGAPASCVPLALAKVGSEPSTGAAGETLAEPLVVRVTDDGAPRAGIEVAFAVEAGGGSVEPESALTDDDGRASAVWTLGIAPVANRVSARIADGSVGFETRATLDAPLAPEPFGDVNAFMIAQGIAGSTEDLAFDGSGRLLLGVPGGLLAVDPAGTTSALALRGEPLSRPLGIAFDRRGTLWAADSFAATLAKVSPAGKVATALADDGTEPLVGPNYVALDRKGRVYLSDPCLGELIRFEPASGLVDAILTFDLPSQGGPNGFAFDASGTRLFIATENTALFCGHAFVGLVDEIAGLFAVEVSDAGFGALEAIAPNVALFGDGVAFDAEGNLYAIFDTEMNLALEESAVWVLPAGDTDLVKFLAATDRVFANLAFGQGDFGDETLYIALLAIPPFTSAEARGLERFVVGIPGLSVPP